MRKIPKKYENPVDNILISIVDKIQPTFYKIGFTPNMITTLSLLICGISIYYFYEKQYVKSALFFGIAYFFDCMDGHYARTYNMVTDFGDYYDHVGDILKHALLFYAMYEVNKGKLLELTPIIVIGTILTFIHLSCQELYYNKEESSTLGLLSYICPANKNNVEEYMEITRYFGSGLYTLLMMSIILIYGYNNNIEK
jgi:phosphatidylglycerophosphate synthase